MLLFCIFLHYIQGDSYSLKLLSELPLQFCNAEKYSVLLQGWNVLTEKKKKRKFLRGISVVTVVFDFYQRNIPFCTCNVRCSSYTSVCKFSIWFNDIVTAVWDKEIYEQLTNSCYYLLFLFCFVLTAMFSWTFWNSAFLIIRFMSLSLVRCKMVFVTLLALIIVINDGLVEVYRIVVCSEYFWVYREWNQNKKTPHFVGLPCKLISRAEQ